MKKEPTLKVTKKFLRSAIRANKTGSTTELFQIVLRKNQMEKLLKLAELGLTVYSRARRVKV